MKKEIDLKTYKKRNQFYYFSKFPDPTYGLDVDIDVTKLVEFKSKNKISFFPCFIYLLTKAINSVYEMHLREENGKVFYYSFIEPTWTVMGKDDVYINVGTPFKENFNTFYNDVIELNEKAKNLDPNDEINTSSLCSKNNVVFASCLPILSVKSFRHPTPSGNHDNLSITRALWDKYHQEKDGTYHITLNITVSHTLVDGFPLARVFQKMQELVNTLEGLE